MPEYKSIRRAVAKLSEQDREAQAREIHISTIVCLMRDYQKSRGIKEGCVANVAYLYDAVRKCDSNISVFPAAVFCRLGKNAKITPHLVLVVDGEPIDPTFSVAKGMRESSSDYFFTVKDFRDHLAADSQSLTKELVQLFVQLINIAKDIYEGTGMFRSLELYTEQAEYIKRTNKITEHVK